MALTVTCRVWPGLSPTDNEAQGTTEISSSDRATDCYSWHRAPMLRLQAGRKLFDKPLSSSVNLCRASSCRPQVDTRFGTRACACCRICVLLSVSRVLEPNKAKSAITTHHPVCGLQQIRFRSRFPSTNKQAATEATCIQLPCDGLVSVSQFPPELCPSIHLFPQGPHGRGPRPFFHRSYPKLLIRC